MYMNKIKKKCDKNYLILIIIIENDSESAENKNKYF